VAGEEELEAHVALRRAAFESTNPTAAHRLTVMRDPEYRPDLDLVAVAPDGTLAGFCLCSIGREENARLGRDEGWVDTLGTRPAYRKLGLGRALLLTGLRRLRASGIAVAVLGTGQGNPAVALYESAGFRVAYRVLWYRRPA
jgi:ribosomal protein S18 acetylase RimI-like enzyme